MSVFVSENLPDEVKSEEIDVAAQMRKGHPQIPEGDAYIIRLIKQYSQKMGRPIRVFDVGCGTGYFASKLAKRLPEIELIANEDEPQIAAKLERRLATDANARVFSGSFEEWNETVDIVLSWGAHHHLPKNYLSHAKQILHQDGIIIVGDEFCPEYCENHHEKRIANAELLYIANGYVLTTAEEVENYQQTGHIPEAALDLERRRQQALWTWYKYVVDFAMDRNCVGVAIDELRATHDDLITGLGIEHKMSPLIVEQEFRLGNFRQISKKVFGPSYAPEYQSFVIYELGI
ncbi:class I SAM-dependent methyltransferase [Scytonema sp. UIC 10036]|uniref:class I SAM-dependent methyltransferase n=1 Tax=Scytonema sp. UIC 10036 TaxID=2304196 RepID=UPI00140FF566|nr:class I SAM-dependent methyltransferase [Scytonema sp. UIC 10036]